MTDSNQFDLVTVGGAMGASALAIAIARAGARVLVLEKEIQFRDRVRAEALAPWGVAEGRVLGIVDLLLQKRAKAASCVEMGFDPRNLVETTPQKEPFLTYCHPEMQELPRSEPGSTGFPAARHAANRGRLDESTGSFV